MKTIAVSQRVDIVEAYSERRDGLDQAWHSLLQQAGIIPLIIPNTPELVNQLLEQNTPAGLLLTGGNDLAAYGGNAPERDCTEIQLLQWALETSNPVLGVCRGMQLIQHYFGTELQSVVGHVNQRQRLVVSPGYRGSDYASAQEDVNSYHHFGSLSTRGPLRTIARSRDNVVMVLEHEEAEVYGIMWHPEREHPFNQLDVGFIRDLFNS